MDFVYRLFMFMDDSAAPSVASYERISYGLLIASCIELYPHATQSLIQHVREMSIRLAKDCVLLLSALSLVREIRLALEEATHFLEVLLCPRIVDHMPQL